MDILNNLLFFKGRLVIIILLLNLFSGWRFLVVRRLLLSLTRFL